MIFITGDFHGGIDANKLNSSHFPQGKHLTKDDYVIVTGDFGIPWYHPTHPYYRQEQYWLKWISDKPWTTLFIDGNHENFDKLDQYEEISWKSGMIHQITSSVYHLMRGYVFSINDLSFFTFGGATSIDKHHRKEFISWWKQELPSHAECARGMNALDDVGWKVDYVITHCAPTFTHTRIHDYYKEDDVTKYLEVLRPALQYKYWFCGHYHEDRYMPQEHLQILYHSICDLSLIE